MSSPASSFKISTASSVNAAAFFLQLGARLAQQEAGTAHPSEQDTIFITGSFQRWGTPVETPIYSIYYYPYYGYPKGTALLWPPSAGPRRRGNRRGCCRTWQYRWYPSGSDFCCIVELQMYAKPFFPCTLHAPFLMTVTNWGSVI